MPFCILSKVGVGEKSNLWVACLERWRACDEGLLPHVQLDGAFPFVCFSCLQAKWPCSQAASGVDCTRLRCATLYAISQRTLGGKCAATQSQKVHLQPLLLTCKTSLFGHWRLKRYRGTRPADGTLSRCLLGLGDPLHIARSAQRQSPLLHSVGRG